MSSCELRNSINSMRDLPQLKAATTLPSDQSEAGFRKRQRQGIWKTTPQEFASHAPHYGAGVDLLAVAANDA